MRKYPLTTGASLAIIALSLMNTGHAELETVPFIDKMVHSGIYFGLSLCAWYEWFGAHQPRISWQSLVAGIGFPIALSALMEVLQAYCTTYRSGDVLDLAANSIGVLAATGLIVLPILYFASHTPHR